MGIARAAPGERTALGLNPGTTGFAKLSDPISRPTKENCRG
jgi:hypothetical protein